MSDYINQNDRTKPLYQFEPSPNGIKEAIIKRKDFQPNREVLVSALKRQYQKTGIKHDLVEANIDLLANKNCFTITTGHQLNLFGSTQYYIYKIVEVIKYCQELKAQFPNNDFVPIFWMASEDHDFDEINHAIINGEKYHWTTNEKGAVGRFNPSQVLEVIEELNDFWKSEPITGSYLKELFKEAYSKSTLADATRFWTYELFKNYGLVIIDGDDHALKGLFRETIKREILHETTDKYVALTNKYLLENDYHIQVYARPINLFYLHDKGRDRIIKIGETYTTVDTEFTFTEKEILEKVQNNPELFSPNALMRPMYQECILPNLAYIGGAGEIAYWLQLKDAFKANGIFFPQVISRNSGIWLNRRLGKKIEKIEIEFKDLFKRKEDLIAEYAESHRSGKRFFQLSETIELLWNEFHLESEKAFHDLKIKTGLAAAENLKELKKLRQNMRKIVKSKNEADLLTLHQVFDSIFPNGGFQERLDTFLPTYLQLGQTYFDALFAHIKPAEHQVIVLEY